MRTNWFSKTVVGMSLVACAVPACDTSKTEEISVTTQAATTTLQAGDVAITCVNTNGDFLDVAALAPLDNDSVIRYTDREATAAGLFNTGENVNVPLSLNPTDAGLATIPPGTIRRTTTTGLGNPTETIFIYQGTIGNPATDAGVLAGGQFLWGFQMSAAGGWVGTRDDAGDLSERLTALGGNDVAVSSSGVDAAVFEMFYYSGPTSGTKAQLKTAIANMANWTGLTAANPALCPTALVVTDAVDAGTDVPVGTGGTDGGGAGGAAGSIDAGGGTGGVAGAGAGGTAGSVDAGGGTGGVAGAGVDAGPGTGGVAGAGAGGSGTGGVAGAGAGGTAGSVDAGGGTGGVAGTGAGGSGTGGVAGAGAGGTAGSAADAGVDVRPDAGNDTTTPTDAVAPTDVRPDVTAPTDVRPDVTTPTDAAKTDAPKTDAGKDAKAPSGDSGCGCSTTSTRESLGTGAWMMALAGIVFTARRRRRKQ